MPCRMRAAHHPAEVVHGLGGFSFRAGFVKTLMGQRDIAAGQSDFVTIGRRRNPRTSLTTSSGMSARTAAKVTDPRAQALFEVIAEVLSGLITVCDHHERKAEPHGGNGPHLQGRRHHRCFPCSTTDVLAGRRQ